MGHLLATVNPEAAAAIQPEGNPFPIREPFIGEIVQYFARPGEGSGGRMVFPALMMHWNSEGMATVIVIRDYDDFRGFSNVSKKSHDRPFNSWDFSPNALEAAAGVNMLYEQVLGDQVPDTISHADKIKNLEERMTALEAIEERRREARAQGVKTAIAARAGARIAKEEASSPASDE